MHIQFDCANIKDVTLSAVKLHFVKITRWGKNIARKKGLILNVFHFKAWLFHSDTHLLENRKDEKIKCHCPSVFESVCTQSITLFFFPSRYQNNPDFGCVCHERCKPVLFLKANSSFIFLSPFSNMTWHFTQVTGIARFIKIICSFDWRLSFR